MNRGNSHPQKVGKKRQIMTKNAYKWFSAAALAIVMTGAVASADQGSVLIRPTPVVKPRAVPDQGATVLLLGAALVTAELIRRKLIQKPKSA